MSRISLSHLEKSIQQQIIRAAEIDEVTSENDTKWLANNASLEMFFQKHQPIGHNFAVAVVAATAAVVAAIAATIQTIGRRRTIPQPVDLSKMPLPEGIPLANLDVHSIVNARLITVK
ncbi:MAG: hypothetical protein P0S95_06105 [Rhabdochlamydiaceae bacterium]|nr:hypothetical protein [Candidatus Amphrikana amoebophyrae]